MRRLIALKINKIEKKLREMELLRDAKTSEEIFKRLKFQEIRDQLKKTKIPKQMDIEKLQRIREIIRKRGK